MTDRTLSEKCSLMARPGGPPPPKVRPPECPDGAAYVTLAEKNGGINLVGDFPMPVIVEGGSGNDQVKVYGGDHKDLRIDGGAGDDTVTLQPEWSWLAQHVGATGLVSIGVAAAVFAALALIVWRALTPPAR